MLRRDSQRPGDHATSTTSSCVATSTVWFDRTLATATVTASVQYDNLTRRYQLSRSIDGRVDAAEVTDDEADVERWITSVDRLSLFSTAGLEPNAEYYVRVRARARPRSHLVVLALGWRTVGPRHLHVHSVTDGSHSRAAPATGHATDARRPPRAAPGDRPFRDNPRLVLAGIVLLVGAFARPARPGAPHHAASRPTSSPRSSSTRCRSPI